MRFLTLAVSTFLVSGSAAFAGMATIVPDVSNDSDATGALLLLLAIGAVILLGGAGGGAAATQNDNNLDANDDDDDVIMRF